MNYSRTKAMILNLGLAMALRLVSFVFGMLSSRILLSVYGSELNGLVASINQFINYINLVELGISSTAIFALYKPIAEKNTPGINSILSATKLYYYKAGYIFATLVLILSILYPIFSNVSLLSGWEVAYLTLVLGSAGVINFFISAKYRVFLIADQRQYIISLLSIVATILNTGIIFVFGYILELPITILKTICILTSLTPAIIIMIYTKRKYKNISFDDVSPDNSALKNRVVVFVNEIAGNIHFGSPIIIITFLVNFLEVSVYSVYITICGGISGILNAIIVPIASSFGVLLAGNDTSSFKTVYRQFEGPFYIISATLFAITYFVLLPFLQVYTEGVTDVNYLRSDFALLMVINMFIVNLYNPQAILVRATGLFKEVQRQTIVQATISVSMGVILTYLWGINGMMVALIVANAYRSLAMIILFDGKVDGVNKNRTFICILESIICFVAIIYICTIAQRLFPTIQIDNMLHWVLYSLCVSGIAIIVMFILLICLQRKETIGLIKRFIK